MFSPRWIVWIALLLAGIITVPTMASGAPASATTTVTATVPAAVQDCPEVGLGGNPDNGEDAAHPFPALSWIDLCDDDGVSVWQMEMSIDRGNALAWNRKFASILVDGGWNLYLATATLSIWMTVWIMEFNWLSWIAEPAEDISAGIKAVVDAVGLEKLLLAIAGFVIGVWIMRGRYALGLFELMVTLVIAVLVTGAWANPHQVLTGDDGLIMQSRQVGLEISNQLAGEGVQTSSNFGAGQDDPGLQQLEQNLTTVFVRQPHDIINYGTTLKKDCRDQASQEMRNGPWGEGAQVREVVEACDEGAGQVAANTSWGMAFGAIIMLPSSAFLMLFAFVLAVFLLLSVVMALFMGIKLIVTGLFGMLPGSARGAFWSTLSDLGVALIVVVFCIVFLGAYAHVITNLFDRRSGGSPVMAFIMLDLLMLIGVVLLFKFRKQLLESSKSIARALSKRPAASGGMPGTSSAALDGAATGGVRRAGDWVRNQRLRNAVKDGPDKGQGSGKEGQWPGSPPFNPNAEHPQKKNGKFKQRFEDKAEERGKPIWRNPKTEQDTDKSTPTSNDTPTPTTKRNPTPGTRTKESSGAADALKTRLGNNTATGHNPKTATVKRSTQRATKTAKFVGKAGWEGVKAYGTAGASVGQTLARETSKKAASKAKDTAKRAGQRAAQRELQRRLRKR